MKKILLSLAIVLSITALFLASGLNFEEIAAQSQVVGEGTAGYIVKWVESAVIPPDNLTVSLSVNPSSGNSPLNTTGTATVAGNAQGTINYAFWWNCNNNSASVSSVSAACGAPTNSLYGAKFNNINQTSQSASNSYSSAGTYYFKVIVERGALSATDSKTISVAAPVNRAPTASNLGAVVSGGGADSLTNDCKIISNVSFSWSYSDPENDSQSATRIQIDNNSGFSSPEFDSNKRSSLINSYNLPVNSLGTGSYYWRLKVWDSKDAESNWISGSSFAVSSSQAVDFSWVPIVPLINQQVTFNSQSTIAISSYGWTFQNGSPATSNIQNPQTKFLSSGVKEAKLSISSGANSCAVSKYITVGGRTED